LAIVANWARTTVFDSDTFAERAVAPLDSEPVRRELARKLTEQLVLAGNQQAVSFRPAFELAIEGAIDTDTFRSIFRNAVRRTHQAILAGQGGDQGLDLSTSFALITSSLQVSGGGGDAAQGQKGLGNSLSDVSKELDDLGVWNLEGTIDTLALVFLGVSLGAGAGSIFLAEDRRRAARRVGWTLVIGGVAIVVVLIALTWLVGRQIEEPGLADAITGALGAVTDHLRLTGLWIAAYGIVIAPAGGSTAAGAQRGGRSPSPRSAYLSALSSSRNRSGTWSSSCARQHCGSRISPSPRSSVSSGL
jgi:hypothetical protein